jgi:ribosomal-protein-alanine N-acetyltransferase
MAECYETERLLLKVMKKADAEAVCNYYLKNRDFLKEWEPSRPDTFFTLEHQAELLGKEYGDIEAGRMLKLWILPKSDPKRVIGLVAFNNIVRGCFLSCHLGYKLDKDMLNRGYATEALEKGIGIIFNEYGLHRIEANIMPRNERSRKIVEKLGFCYEGLSRQYLKINGRWEDHEHWVLLNPNV